MSVNVDSLSELGNTISETVYNTLNQTLTVTDAMGKATTYTYNALGKVESVTDSLNHRTEFTYNSRGQNTAVRDAANNVSSATYDLLGTYLWSIYSLVPEFAIGVAQWEHDPILNSRSPYFQLSIFKRNLPAVRG